MKNKILGFMLLFVAIFQEAMSGIAIPPVQPAPPIKKMPMQPAPEFIKPKIYAKPKIEPAPPVEKMPMQPIPEVEKAPPLKDLPPWDPSSKEKTVPTRYYFYYSRDSLADTLDLLESECGPIDKSKLTIEDGINIFIATYKKGDTEYIITYPKYKNKKDNSSEIQSNPNLAKTDNTSTENNNIKQNPIVSTKPIIRKKPKKDTKIFDTVKTDTKGQGGTIKVPASTPKTNEKLEEKKKDKVPPTITVLKNYFEISVGDDDLDYASGAVAIDDVDGRVPIKIKGKWNNNKAGTYHLKYVAQDKAGNKSYANFILKIKEK